MARVVAGGEGKSRSSESCGECTVGAMFEWSDLYGFFQIKAVFFRKSCHEFDVFRGFD